MRTPSLLAGVLDRLIKRLDAGQLLERGRILVKGILGVIGRLNHDGLRAGGGDIKRLHRGLKTVFAELLNGFEVLVHYESPQGKGAWRLSGIEPYHTPAWCHCAS